MSRLKAKVSVSTWFSWNWGAATTRRRQPSAPRVWRSSPCEEQEAGLGHAQAAEQGGQGGFAAAGGPFEQEPVAGTDP